MNQNNPNPHIAFGRPSYNPVSQSQTDGEVWMAQIYPGFEDPTQVPMRPGDTERPMYPPQQPQFPQQQLNGQLPQSQFHEMAQAMVNQMRQVATQQVSQPQVIQPQHPTQPQQSVQPIRVPLVFDLTFNLTINLNINPVQQNG